MHSVFMRLLEQRRERLPMSDTRSYQRWGLTKPLMFIRYLDLALQPYK